MTVFTRQLAFDTRGRGTLEITGEIAAVLVEAAVENGLCNVFVQHTSASLIVCENADPSVRRDLERYFGDAIPDGDPRYEHSAEGPDDMPAHVRSILTDVSINIPVIGGRLALGTCQGVYLWEHRTSPHRRHVVVSVVD